MVTMIKIMFYVSDCIGQQLTFFTFRVYVVRVVDKASVRT